jgi:hypothetical protein
MIIYMPEPMDLLNNQNVPECKTISLPSGGYLNLEILDSYKARVIGVVSTDPMDYMNQHYQPGNLLDLTYRI